MRLSRRDFLKWSSLSAIGAVSCIFPDREMQIASSVEMPEDLVTGRDNWYATLCGQCPEREGIIVRVMEGRAKKIQGNPLYPTNLGGQSARCEAGLQAIYHPDRLSGPMLRSGPRGSGFFEPTTWQDALTRVTNELRQLQAGGNTEAMLVVTDPLRGQLGNVVGRFATAFGGRHMAFEAMEQPTLNRVVKDVFGQDTLPDLDIDNSGYVLSFGADLLSTWVSPVRYSRGYGRFRSHSNGTQRGHFVHADPRYSMTAANADQWIPVIPGREGILALSIAHEIISQGLGDRAAAQAMTSGAGAAALEAFSPDNVVRSDNPLYVGIPESMRGVAAADIIRNVAHGFAERGPALAIGGGEAGAQSNGMFNLTAIYALNFLVGSVGRRPGSGGVVFNPAPPVASAAVDAGSLTDWMTAAEDLRSGSVRVLMVRGANPVHGLPGSVRFASAIKTGRPFVVSFSNFLDDTAMMADVVLPDRLPLEDWGDDVPNPGPGYQVVGFQQPVVNPPPGLDPRSFPDLLLTMSQELGLDDGLPNTFRDVLREEAQALQALGRGSVEGATFEGFWNGLLQQGGWWDEGAVSSAAPPVPPSLAELVSQTPTPVVRSIGGGANVFQMVPFLSNSLLDGRGAHLPWLQATPDPMTSVTWQTWVEINTGKVKEMGLEEGDVVRLVNNEGRSIEAVVYPHPAMPPWVVGVPVGQGHASSGEYAMRDGEKRGDNPISILASEPKTETGSLAWGATEVRVEATDRSIRVSKFEGIVPAFPIGVRDEDIVQVSRE